MPTNRAAIFPLDYSDALEPVRIEHSISLFSTDWKELQTILEDPVNELRDLGPLWPQRFPYDPGASKIRWQIQAPVEARIEYLAGDNSAVHRLACACNVNTKVLREESDDIRADLTRALASKSDKLLEPIPIDLAVQAVMQMIQPFLTLQQIADTVDLTGGYFLLEFAPRTRFMTIKYGPPQKNLNEFYASYVDPGREPAKGRMPIFTRATFGVLGDQWKSQDDASPQPGILHFDIGRPGYAAQDRAAFIMDHLENPARTCQVLNQGRQMDQGNSMVGDGNIYTAALRFFNQGQTIPISELAAAPIDSKHPFNVANPGDWPDPSKVDAETSAVRALAALNNSQVMPSLTVEGMSTNDPSQVCVVGPTCPLSGANQIMSLNLKDYIPPGGTGGNAALPSPFLRMQKGPARRSPGKGWRREAELQHNRAERPVQRRDQFVDVILVGDQGRAEAEDVAV